jgi:hypothetical protein
VPIQLSWSPPLIGGPTVLSYKIYKRINDSQPIDPFTDFLGIVAGNVLSYTDASYDRNILYDTGYLYALRAVNFFGESDLSNTTLITFDFEELIETEIWETSLPTGTETLMFLELWNVTYPPTTTFIYIDHWPIPLPESFTLQWLEGWEIPPLVQTWQENWEYTQFPTNQTWQEPWEYSLGFSDEEQWVENWGEPSSFPTNQTWFEEWEFDVGGQDTNAYTETWES